MLWIVVLIVLLLGLGLFVFNSLVSAKNHVDEAWSGIDTQLKRRYDLVPNLVETVKGYASHEKNVLLNVTKARSIAMNAMTPEEHAKAEGMLTETLKSLFVLAESYPELQASTGYLDLQKNLAHLEGEINMARRYYNAVVRDYNTIREVFPNALFAGMFGFGKREFFDMNNDERSVPQITL